MRNLPVRFRGWPKLLEKVWTISSTGSRPSIVFNDGIQVRERDQHGCRFRCEFRTADSTNCDNDGTARDIGANTWHGGLYNGPGKHRLWTRWKFNEDTFYVMLIPESRIITGNINIFSFYFVIIDQGFKIL